MTDQFKLSGDFGTTPATGSCSSMNPTIEARIDERLSLARKLDADYTLTIDSPVAVDLGGLLNVGVLIVKAVEGKIRVRVTSADGTAQAFPVDGYLSLITKTVPITAIDLTRVAGVETRVRLFMGERAS